MPRLRRSEGFTAIELAFVLALLATFASVGLPNLSDSREKSNEAHAIKDMRAVSDAQSHFHDSYGVFAKSLQQLAAAGLLDDILGSGQDHGYDFDISARGQGWIAVAVPKYSDNSSSFYADEKQICPPGWHYMYGYFGKCVPNPIPSIPAGVRASSMESSSLAAAAALDRLSLGTALPAAKRLTGDEAFRPAAIMALDANRDGSLTFDELLNADLLALARSLRASGPIVPIDLADGPPRGDDSAVRTITTTYLRETRAALRLGVAHETETPAVPLPGLRGYPDAFLELVVP